MNTGTNYFLLSCMLSHVLVNMAVSLLDKRITCALPNAEF